ncbi:MAG: thiamine-binding protein [Acidimicrobiales bacterium]|jgi:uncharacterized protein YqgV (UPF0045/DUF77 family)|nr:thiamine-binding protein [Acidimicrobiales bacterium]|tara:strand:+ start:209 stop:436 length:228 start_codon:yes stop_codon:yes gene_type:complete
MTAEFTIEPFVDGDPGPHVLAAIEVAESAGLAVEIGPFGTSVGGDPEVVLSTVDGILRAAVGNGATRISLQVNTG